MINIHFNDINMFLLRDWLFPILKRQQWIYFLHARFERDVRVNRKRMKKSSKSKAQMRAEMCLLEKYWHCYPMHYVRYALFDRNLSQEELLDYIPPYYFYNFYVPKVNTDIACVSKNYANKLFLYRLFVERGISTPEVLAYLQAGKLYSVTDPSREFPFSEISHWMNVGDRLFFKPCMGQGGAGIAVLQKTKEGFTFHGRKVSLRDFASELTRRKLSYIVQKGICQRTDISLINASSVNTLRVVTQWRDSVPFICVCVLRIGRNGAEVDNSAQGGISVRVDVVNGELNPLAYEEHGSGCFTEHPDTRYVFQGQRISDWQMIRDAILQTAAKFPELQEVAWDIAIVEGGIEVIELNLLFGIDHLQQCCGGMRRVLDVYPQLFNGGSLRNG